MYSHEVHATASRMASTGKCPMSCRIDGSGWKAIERSSRRPRISTCRMIAMRRLLFVQVPDAGVRGECCNCDMGDSAAPRPDPIRIRTLALRASGSVMADHLRHRRELVEHPHRILRVQHGHRSAKSNRLGPRRDSAVHRPAGIRAAHRSRRRQSRGNRLGVSRPSRAQ